MRSQRRLILAGVGTALLMAAANGGQANMPPAKSAPLASAPTASAEREQFYISSLGTVTATTVAVTAGVDGQLADCVGGRPVKLGELLVTIESPQPQPDRAKQQVRAPISGLASFCKVDPGNLVHSGEVLLTVTQLHPITVVFSVPQEVLPRIRALLGSGVAPVVEVFDRSGSARLASGRLTSMNNEIDTTTGTISLKASFENADGALFPNAFVNVRMPIDARQSSRH